MMISITLFLFHLYTATETSLTDKVFPIIMSLTKSIDRHSTLWSKLFKYLRDYTPALWERTPLKVGCCPELQNSPNLGLPARASPSPRRKPIKCGGWVGPEWRGPGLSQTGTEAPPGGQQAVGGLSQSVSQSVFTRLRSTLNNSTIWTINVSLPGSNMRINMNTILFLTIFVVNWLQGITY